MKKTVTLKELVIWLVFITFSLVCAFWLIYKSANTVYEGSVHKLISHRTKQLEANIKIQIPETQGFFIELEKTTLGNNKERYFSDFKETIDGVTTRGTVVLLDDIFVEKNSFKVMPMVLNFGGSGEFYYLALFDEKLNHLNSFYIDADIKIIDLKGQGSDFIFEYKIHDIDQARVEEPSIEKTFIFEIVGEEILEK